MSDDQNDGQSPPSAMYVLLIVAFVLGFTVLQVLVAAGIHIALYGAPSINEMMTMKAPEYSHAVLWKGRAVFPAINIQPGSPIAMTLMSFDPEKGDSSELPIAAAMPIVGFLVQDDRFWTVSRSSVVLTQGDESTEFSPTRALTRACEPFLYEGQLAVVDMGIKGPPMLMVFQKNDWVDVGPVVIPFAFQKEVVDGKSVLVPSAASGSGRVASLLDLQIISHDGKIHLFLSDSATMAYHEGLELAQVSALAPANVSDAVDLSNLSDWEVISDISSYVGMRGRRLWKAGLSDGEPVVVAVSSVGQTPNPFQSVSLLGFQRINGVWTQTGQIKTSAVLDLAVVSDGETTYFGAPSLGGNLLRVYRFSGTQMEPTGAVVKPPQPGFQSTMQRWARLHQWVYWPCLFLFALGVNYLMRMYRSAEYQFGAGTAELASFLRRGFARTIDYFVYMLPSYLVTVAFGMSSQEYVENNADRIFDLGPEGMMIPWALMMLSLVLVNLTLLIINSFLQGWWGVTLGKWICGIRTVRSTLRPCGFFRASLRELLLFIDTACAITLIPATLMIAITRCRQRVGDFLADTIVIRKPTSE